MRRTRIAVLLAVACGLVAVAVSSASTPGPTHRARTAAAAAFVATHPLTGATQLVRYSLATGRWAGVLARIPSLRSTARYATASTPHLIAHGRYLITLTHTDLCRSSHGACHASPNTCASEIQSLNPGSGAARTLFGVTGAWRVNDAVPSPDGRSVALVESGCQGYASRLAVRDLSSGRTHLVTSRLSPCGIASDATWSPDSRTLLFAYGRHLNLDLLPAGCALAAAPAGRTSGPASWSLLRLPRSCGFDAIAVDAVGLLAIQGCTDRYGGITSTLLQYDQRRQLRTHHRLDSFDPPQYGLDVQLEADAAAHTVLVSEIVTDDPDISDVWTFDGTTLHHVRNYFGADILAEP